MTEKTSPEDATTLDSCILLHPPTHDADPPEWGHFKCPDGYAWHPEPIKRPCYGGITNVPAALVAKVFTGPAIERILALREVLKGYPGAFFRIFTTECKTCGQNHQRSEGKKWARVALAIHEGAIEALRKANPARRRIMDVRNLKSAHREALVALPPTTDKEEEKAPKKDTEAKQNRRDLSQSKAHLSGIPICDTPFLTLQAQLGFARSLTILKSKPVAVLSPPRPPPMFRMPRGRPRKDGNPPGWRPPPSESR